MKLISIVTPTYNESGNIEQLIESIMISIDPHLSKYNFEIIIIDNNSIDGTREVVRSICSKYKNVKAIFNTRNFGHIRSPYWGIMQASGDAVIYMASDFQDPPELIGDFISHWESGSMIVYGVNSQSQQNNFFSKLRRMYYRILNKISDMSLTENSSGFGLYDIRVINHLRAINDPYPYLRGLIDDLGYDISKINFVRPSRKRGISKNNIYTLYDIAILGVISHSKVPLRLSIVLGALSAFCSVFLAMSLIIIKLFDWQALSPGLTMIGAAIFLLFSALFILIGVLGEYVISIHTYVKKRPIVVESERINF